MGNKPLTYDQHLQSIVSLFRSQSLESIPQKFDRELSSEEYHDLLVAALKIDDVSEVRYILNHSNYDSNSCLNDERETPVMIAARNSSIKCLRYLISNGAQMMAENKEGKTVFDQSLSPEVREILDQQGHDLTRVDAVERDTHVPSERALDEFSYGNYLKKTFEVQIRDHYRKVRTERNSLGRELTKRQVAEAESHRLASLAIAKEIRSISETIPKEAEVVARRLMDRSKAARKGSCGLTCSNDISRYSLQSKEQLLNSIQHAQEELIVKALKCLQQR